MILVMLLVQLHDFSHAISTSHALFQYFYFTQLSALQIWSNYYDY